MIASVFKRVAIFQPYNFPIQPLIISQKEKNSFLNNISQKLVREKNTDFSFDEEQPRTRQPQVLENSIKFLKIIQICHLKALSIS